MPPAAAEIVKILFFHRNHRYVYCDRSCADEHSADIPFRRYNKKRVDINDIARASLTMTQV